MRSTQLAPSVVRLVQGGPGYPACLGALPDPPRQLFCIGDLTALGPAPEALVAIVGTREATLYGLRVATALGRAFAKAAAIVVSGMAARGVDSAAHDAAIKAGGKTIAVLGTGLYLPYPVANRELHSRVAAGGLIVSESEPGTKAFQGCFPRRNRIIAALYKATIVIKAGHKSGAINTATHAGVIGRLFAAVPGPIDSPRSAGANQLIRDGEHLIGSIDDALGLLGLPRSRAEDRPAMGVTEAEVWDCLGAGEHGVDALCARSGLPVRSVMEAVSRLELAGLVTRSPDGRIGRSLASLTA